MSIGFTPKYVIFLGTIVNDIVCLISVFTFVISIQKWDRFLFADLVSCSLTELSSRSLGVESMDFSMQIITWCANRESFYFFPYNMYVFYFFFLPYCTAITSSSMLNNSSASGHPWLDAAFRRKAFSISSVSMMSVIFFVGTFYQVEEFPPIFSLIRFYINILSKALTV